MRDFRCIVRMRGEKSTIQSAIMNTKLRISRKTDFLLDDNGRSFKEGTNSGEVHVMIQTKATSHFFAAVQALQECWRVVDIGNLYNNRSSIAISSTVLAHDGIHTEIIDRHPEKFLNPKPHRDARRLTREALANVPFSNLDEGLDNALEYHSLALASSEGWDRALNGLHMEDSRRGRAGGLRASAPFSREEEANFWVRT